MTIKKEYLATLTDGEKTFKIVTAQETLEVLIGTAKADLSLSGVYDIREDDPLIGRAIIVYCQAHFGANADSDRYQQSYTMLKEHLALSLKYNGGEGL